VPSSRRGVERSATAELPWGRVTDRQLDPDSRAVDRLTLFSDAVVAIAITLLAIDLPIPTGGTVAEFWSSVQQNAGHYAAFSISFLAIAAAWAHHGDIFRYLISMDPRLRTLNTVWLLTIVLNPFATRLLTSHGHETIAVHAFRFGFYSLLEAATSASLLAVLHHMRGTGEAPALPPKVASGTTWGSAGLIIGFGLSIPVFFATTYAWALWFLGPFFVAQVYRLRGQDRHKPVRP
jgi:uncharacterized membrane protein